MCVVSNIGDEWSRTFPEKYPQFVPVVPTTQPHQVYHDFQPVQDALRECSVCGYPRDYFLHNPSSSTTSSSTTISLDLSKVSKEDFDALKAEVEELKILLLAAKRFDEATGQKDCEMDEKVEFIRTVAEFIGVDVDEVFGSPE